jgi:hypothetical protein
MRTVLIKKLFRQALLTLMLILLPCLVREARACSCTDYDIPPCAAYWAVDSVFTGLVTEVTTVPSESWLSVGGDVIVHFAVEQAFRGIKETKVEVVTHGEQSSCNMGFKAGQRWLVYASGTTNGRLATGPCIRTKRLPSDQDLAYIMSVAGEYKPHSILGRIGKRQYEPFEGIKVIIEGGSNKYQTFTDSEGKFNVDLPQAGAYKVRLFVPYSAYVLNLSRGFDEIKSNPTEKLTVAEYDVNLNAGQCDYRQIIAFEKDLKATAEISGKVLDSEGAPVSNQMVYLYPATAGQEFSSGGYEYARTDEEGNYTFTELREGRYWLGINLGRMPEADSPYAMTFYPGEQDRKKAAAIILNQGQKLSKRDIRLGPALVEREITGNIVWPDGRPALAPPPGSESPGLRPNITLRDPEHLQYSLNPRRDDETLIVKVDDGGHFSFVGYEGYTYVIIADAYDAAGKQWHSKALKLKIIEGVRPLTLVLSIPGYAGENELKKELSGKP